MITSDRILDFILFSVRPAGVSIQVVGVRWWSATTYDNKIIRTLFVVEVEVDKEGDWTEDSVGLAC